MKLDLTVIVEKFNGLQDPIRYGIYGSVLVLIFVLDFFTVMNFQRSLVKNAAIKIEKLKTDIDHVDNDKKRIGQMRQNLEVSRKDFEKFSLKIRQIGELPAILDEISRYASVAGLKLDQLTPQRDKQEKLKSVDGKNYFGLPVAIEAHGGYHVIARFLNNLENGNIYFALRDMLLDSDAKNGGISLRLVIKVILVENNDPAP